MYRKFSSMTALAILCGAMALTGCNTMKGAGRDVSAAGHAVTNAAQDTQTDMTHNNPPPPPPASGN